MRTKKGDENSYCSEDDINAINMNFKETYNDVYKVYKGLIALRKSSDAFTAGQEVNATKLADGVTKYTLSGTSDDFCIYFNATEEDATSDVTNDYSTVIDVTEGIPSNNTAELPIKIPAKNFVILKK